MRSFRTQRRCDHSIRFARTVYKQKLISCLFAASELDLSRNVQKVSGAVVGSQLLQCYGMTIYGVEPDHSALMVAAGS